LVGGPVTLSGLADGSHVFQARATDDLGNVEDPPASASFAVDTSKPAPAPETTIGPVARKLTKSHVTVTFAASIPGSTFTCALGKAAPAPCTSPKTLRHLTPGHYVFSVIATSPDGVTDATPAQVSFRVKHPPRG
jgi:hypothetical protein